MKHIIVVIHIFYLLPSRYSAIPMAYRGILHGPWLNFVEKIIGKKKNLLAYLCKQEMSVLKKGYHSIQWISV